LSHPQPTPLLVLDSNVVLDWLVFRDPSCRRLDETIARGAVRWVATVAMRDELEHVLTRTDLSAWQPDRALIWSAWARWAALVEAAAAPLAARLRCTDADDQKFIDLALQVGAAALLSRDRAVLKLGAHARPLGLAIQTVADWERTLPPE
jgi:predicted nucleic acid-binding protein